MNTFIKIILTALLVLIASFPYFQNGQAPGGLSELQYMGIIPSIILVVGFFTAIAFYCYTLQKVLQNVKPDNRTRKPKSIWFMYLIPFNFIEDFFIVIDVSNSLKNEMKTNKNLTKFGDFGLTLGIGWSVAQLFSFIPNIAGQISGLIGIILWIIHWVLLHRINKVLQQPTPNK
ncbi:hypothetical protein SAMN04489761_4133 [Tenacibaculum sp. MAR_2009_124]|uniref:hypothetical protein n=1 Tax=Tenacibaculum sp. MAR_2009_124 TaxID=1250059 RepID=UPI000894E0DC|nr:hypothetical protein [Tenacibaculum sp. MAR_2009_124]SED05802.1 hypothetical protein SAMN04489761_4133 [Tenacibaculum sp. MAR_2009_124]